MATGMNMDQIMTNVNKGDPKNFVLVSNFD